MVIYLPISNCDTHDTDSMTRSRNFITSKTCNLSTIFLKILKKTERNASETFQLRERL